jgi:hypothetical protein
MTTTTTEEATAQTADAAQQAIDQTRRFGNEATDASREFGRMMLNSYEQVVNTFVDLEQRAAEAMPNDWMRATISAHASFIGDVNRAYLRSMHSVLD